MNICTCGKGVYLVQSASGERFLVSWDGKRFH